MLDNLQTIAPDSEIILCTLATSPFYTEANRISYNDVITNYGKEYNLLPLHIFLNQSVVYETSPFISSLSKSRTCIYW